MRREKRDEYIAKHRNGKAAAIVRNIPAGAWTTGQRLSGGNVGTEVTDLPAQPETAIRRDAKALVQQIGVALAMSDGEATEWDDSYVPPSWMSGAEQIRDAMDARRGRRR